MTFIVAHILVAYMVLVMPWIGQYKYHRLQRQVAEGIPNARLRFYRLTLLQQLLLITLVVLFALSARLPLSALGIAAPYSWSATRGLLIAFTLAILASIVLFRCTGDRFLVRLLKMAGALLPGTPVERCHFAAISLGAGITEELLFRGFLIWYLGFYFSRLTSLELIVISSVLFGVCHLYQGVLGVIGTGVIGAVFASLYLTTGSLLLPATVHALVDLRMLAILTPGRLRRLQPKFSGCLPQETASSAAKIIK